MLGVNADGSAHGVFTDRPGVLTNDVFRVVTSMPDEWTPADPVQIGFTLTERGSGAARFTATRCDLVFGANSELRHTVKVYAADDGHERLVRDFVRAWHKVRMLDRFGVPEARKEAVSIC